MYRLTMRRRVAAIFFMVFLAACNGGGSGGDHQASTTISTNTLTFNATSPDAAIPSSQTIVANVSPGTTYVSIQHSGVAVANASYSLTGTTVQVTVDPASPSILGVGDFTGVVTVTGYTCADPACSALTPGNNQIVNVTYHIPPIVRFVAPYVATANIAGTVIIRGQGFQKYSVSGVTFGATAATAFTVVSDTEIQASYPMLTAGNYPVQILLAPSGATPVLSQANLVAVNAPNYSVTTLAYPAATPQVGRLLYDAERQALLVADKAGSEVLRYPYSGGSWGAPAVVSIGSLADIALSTGGQQLLTLTQTALTPLDPVTLAAGSSSTPAPVFAATGTYFKNLAAGNDGNVVVTTGFAGSINTSLYVYPSHSPAFNQPASTPSLDNATPVASADGSLLVLMQGDAALTTAPAAYQYLAASVAFSATSASLNQNAVAPALSVYTPPATISSTTATPSTTRLVLSGINASNISVTNVYDANYNLLGTLPGTTLAVAVKPDATRAYTFDSTASQILSFDLTATPAGGAFPQVGTGTSLAGNPGAGVQMTISPDGGTLFLAGSSQIVIQPSPP